MISHNWLLIGFLFSVTQSETFFVAVQVMYAYVDIDKVLVDELSESFALPVRLFDEV